MPNGGFGNLIALPFQGKCSKEGNTVFVNRYFEVIDNQLEVLSNIKRIKHEYITDFIEKYGDEDITNINDKSDDKNIDISNSKKIVFTNNIECTFSNKIYINKKKLLPNEISYLKRLASFTNPEYYKKQKMRLPVYNIPRIITCFEEDSNNLILPRGCIDDIKDICNESNVKLKITDNRNTGIKTNLKFCGILTNKQEEVKNILLQNDIGILCANTGFGKTVLAISIIAELNVSTIILVHRANLLEQWINRLITFLNISKEDIGQIGSGKNSPNGIIDVCTFQSLFKKEDTEKNTR